MAIPYDHANPVHRILVTDLGQRPPRYRPPSLATMERWMRDGIARATDGCRVEPDGECQHGARSWLRHLGYI